MLADKMVCVIWVSRYHTKFVQVLIFPVNLKLNVTKTVQNITIDSYEKVACGWACVSSMPQLHFTFANAQILAPNVILCPRWQCSGYCFFSRYWEEVQLYILIHVLCLPKSFLNTVYIICVNEGILWQNYISFFIFTKACVNPDWEMWYIQHLVPDIITSYINTDMKKHCLDGCHSAILSPNAEQGHSLSERSCQPWEE